MIELEELEAAGWGSHPQFLIPKNWRERKPAARERSGWVRTKGAAS
jgi:hypothetical protein